MAAKGFSLRVKKLSDVSAYWPGFKKAWPAIKAECGTSQRSPKYVSFTEEARPMMPNDTSCAKRFLVEIESGKVHGALHVSCGENALMNRGQELAMGGFPANVVLVSCEWNDFYRSFSMEVQAAPGVIKPELAEAVA